MMIFFYICYLSLCAAVPNISVSRGSNTTLTCKLNGAFTLPEWVGPPNLTKYNNQGDRIFNPTVPVVVENRLDWTNDDVNLVIKSVKQSDSGQYWCHHLNITVYKFELVVTEPEDTNSPENTTRLEPKQITGAEIAYIVIAVVLVVCAVIIGYCVWRKRKTLKTKCCRQKPQINQDTPSTTANEKVPLVELHSIHGDTPGTTANEEAPLVDARSTHGEKSFSAEEWKIVKVLQRQLISHYRQLFCSLQISPLIEEVGYASSFLDLYVKPILTIQNLQGAQGQKTKVMTFHDIFGSNSKQYKSVYISSQAGCGKTSFAKYLALIWCQAHLPVVADSQWTLEEDVKAMRAFEFLFFVFLRAEHEKECDVDIMIQNQLLLNLANSTAYKDLGLKFLQNLLYSVKCIIILDGLDEWSHPSGRMCTSNNKRIPHIKARPLCTTLTTSRPWKLDVVGLKLGEIDQKLELNDLEGHLFERLIDNVVTKLNEIYGKDMQAYDFERELRDKKLTDFNKIPVVVMQLLTMWFDNEPLGKSQCEIYSNMIEFLLKRYCKKREIVYEIEDTEVDGCCMSRQIPMCLQNRMYCKVHMELLLKLATLAYNTLFTHIKESSLVFDREIAKKYLETDEEIEMSLDVGILTQEKVLGKITKRQSHISFIHKTFQEYLAALHVALSPGMVTNVVEKIKDVCCSIEKILEMSQIFLFVSGLCPEVMANLHEHLRLTVSKDSRPQIYRASCKLNPWSSEALTLKQVQYTMVQWLGECWLNGHKHVTHFPLSDFFIESSSPWSDELRSLTVHNPVCSLYVSGVDYISKEIEDILNSVTEFNSIQKLSLWMVETFVVQLVSQHKHSMNLRPETWRHLECVTLMAMTMSGDILCSLVDSVLQLPKSVQVRLENCSIKQETRAWEAYIRSHPRLTVDDDSEIVCHVLQFRTKTV